MTGQGSKNPSQFVLDISTASSVYAPLLRVPSANVCPTVIQSPSMTLGIQKNIGNNLRSFTFLCRAEVKCLILVVSCATARTVDQRHHKTI